MTRRDIIGRPKMKEIEYMPGQMPTLGEVAERRQDLKGRGATLESVLYVAKEKVWWDTELYK